MAYTPAGGMLYGGHMSTCVSGVVPGRWALHAWLSFQRSQCNHQPWGAKHQNQTKSERKIRNPSSLLVFENNIHLLKGEKEGQLFLWRWILQL